MIIPCLCTALHSSLSWAFVMEADPSCAAAKYFRYHRTFFWDQCQTNRAVAFLSSPRARTHTCFPGMEGYCPPRVVFITVLLLPTAELQPLILTRCFVPPGICFCNCIELLDMWTLGYDSFFRYPVILKHEQVILRQEGVISGSGEICVTRTNPAEWGEPKGWRWLQHTVPQGGC